MTNLRKRLSSEAGQMGEPLVFLVVIVLLVLLILALTGKL